jgi:hypothetical protein
VEVVDLARNAPVRLPVEVGVDARSRQPVVEGVLRFEVRERLEAGVEAAAVSVGELLDFPGRRWSFAASRSP